jgi:heat shock protein HslJ
MGGLGDEKVFGLLATTLMAGPPELMDQESAFLALLQEADSMVVGDDRMTLFHGDSPLVELDRESGEDETDIIDRLQGTWEVVRYRSGDRWRNPVSEDHPATLTFDGDVIVGTLGVNRLRGQVGADGMPGPLTTTRMAGPAAAMEQEAVLLDLLHGADSIVFDMNGMSWSRNGLSLVELRRSGTNITDRSSQ